MSQQYGEPWKAIGHWLYDCDNKPLVEGMNICDVKLDRIIACVNFLAGVPTDKLESFPEDLRSSFVALINSATPPQLVGDGVTDDGPAIQAMVDRHVAEIPKGRHK